MATNDLNEARKIARVEELSAAMDEIAREDHEGIRTALTMAKLRLLSRVLWRVIEANDSTDFMRALAAHVGAPYPVIVALRCLDLGDDLTIDDLEAWESIGSNVREEWLHLLKEVAEEEDGEGAAVA